jgi:hypothetical protein
MDSTVQSKSEELHDGNLKLTEGSSSNSVALMKDNVVLNKGPTLVLHENLPVESSSGGADLNGKVMAHELLQGGPPGKVELENKESSSSDVFSFQAGRQNIGFQKVRSLCIAF